MRGGCRWSERVAVLMSSLRWLPLTPPPLPYLLSYRRHARNVPSLSPLNSNAAAAASSSPPPDHLFPLGAEDACIGFMSGRTKLTDLAHAVWRKYVGKGDVVVDATCGNGHDTLALLQMVADHESKRGRVYALDIQDSALASTSTLLDASVGPHHRQLVKLFMHCHSKMEDVLSPGTSARLIAFNLGYLPGGDKSIITNPSTTLPALQAATRLLVSGGIISVMVYVGHPGGMDELEVVKAFASSLSTDLWNCCRFENINRPAAPVLILLFKKP